MKTRKDEKQLFAESAWLLFNNRERILADPRMAHAPIDMQNGLMYFGSKAFEGATIGAYLEWWQTCEEAITTDADGQKSLIVRFGGSPLSGWNKCCVVAQNGKVSETQVPHLSSRLWMPFARLCQQYAQGEQPEQPFCLEEVVCRLTGQTSRCIHFIKERLKIWR